MSGRQAAIFVLHSSRVELHRSARKHGVADHDIVHAALHALAAYALEDGDDEPRRTLLLGPDRAGNLLELVVLELDDARRLVIHAMPMRPMYRDLLPQPDDS
jgi:hypothetical protein